MRYFRPILFLTIVLSILAFTIPHPAYAANATFFGPIVPQACHCDNQPNPTAGGAPITTAPAWGCILQTLQNGINLLISLGIILCILYLAYAGAILVTSAGSPGAREQGKTRVMNGFIGLVVILSAWLIVDFVMKTLYNSSDSHFGPWNGILASNGNDSCIVAKNPGSLVSGTISLLAGAPGSTIPAGASGNAHMNIQSAVAYANSHVQPGSTNACAQYVRLALAAGGLVSFNASHPQYAYQYGPYLEKAGLVPVVTANYSSSLEGNIPGLQAGDVVVFQPVGSHTAGHIAIYNGSNWVSDYSQKTMTSSMDYVGTSFTIYRP